MGTDRQPMKFESSFFEMQQMSPYEIAVTAEPAQYSVIACTQPLRIKPSSIISLVVRNSIPTRPASGIIRSSDIPGGW
jgi:hypothetical protein